MREKEFKTMQEDLQYHKDKHEHYRARCDVQEKVRASPAILQWTASITKKPDPNLKFQGGAFMPIRID